MRRLLFPEHGKNYVRNLLIRFFIGLFIALFVVVPAALAYFLSHPTRHAVCCTTPADLGLTYESVTFPASDGVKLSGWYIPSQNGAAIIAVHANGGNRTGVLVHAQVLAEAGYGVLLFDVRGFGESEGSLAPYPPLGMAEDVIGAVDYLQQRPDVDDERIGAVGLSLGANMILIAAAENDSIRAVLADGATESRTIEDVPGLNAMPPLLKAYMRIVINITMRLMGIATEFPGPFISDSIQQIAPRPILLISTGVSEEQAQNAMLYEHAGEPKTLWDLPDVAHIHGLFARPEEYRSKMLEFFDQALLDKPT